MTPQPFPLPLTPKGTAMTDRILIVRARNPEDALNGRDPLALGVATRARDGWRFMPFTSSHKASRKGHKTLEAALPRWTGGRLRRRAGRFLPGGSGSARFPRKRCKGRLPGRSASSPALPAEVRKPGRIRSFPSAYGRPSFDPRKKPA